MKVRDILDISDEEIRGIAKFKPGKILKGKGKPKVVTKRKPTKTEGRAAVAGGDIIQLRADQQMISRLARTPILNRGVRGALNFYKKIDDKKQIVRMRFPRSEVLTKNSDQSLDNPAIVNSPVYFLSQLQQYQRKLVSAAAGTTKNIMLEMKDSFQKKHEQLNSKKEAAGAKKEKRSKSLAKEPEVTDQISDLVSKLLISFRENITGFEYSRFRINEVAQYDFDEFRFLAEPTFVNSANPISVQFQDFVNKASEIIADIVQGDPPTRRKWRTATVETANYFVEEDYTVGGWIYDEADVMVDDGEVVDAYTTQSLIDLFIKYFLDYLASDLFEIENKILYPPGASTLDAFAEWFYQLYGANDWSLDSVNSSSDSPALWEDSLDEVLVILHRLRPDLELGELKYVEGNGYDFRPYSSKSVAFGIRLNYKQNWCPLGVQSGETVRTIPLGPKQVEKITTKTTSSVKKLDSRETSTSIETSTETTDSSKLSNDIVNESGAKVNAEVSSKVSVPIDIVSVEGTTRLGTELSSSSKETKSQLNEKMEKTSQRMKNDVKVVVSNEFQSTSEYDRSTEISNPNDDIAITYIYSKLQQQYELITFLNEVTNVVFVPEALPNIQDITKEWIRRYDWILARNLLDDSFQADLTAILNDIEDDDDYSSDFDKDHFKDISVKAKDALPDYTTFKPGGAAVDLFQAQNEIYLRQLDKIRAIKERGINADKSFHRFKDHLQANILHYMRTIWLAEDKDQRLLRYNERLVPTKWVFVPNHSPDQAAESGPFAGSFVPDLSAASLRRLSSIIEPTGPIGFAGNCLVFLMKSNPDLMNLNDGLRTLKAYYIQYQLSTQNENLGGIKIIHKSAVYLGFSDPLFAVSYKGDTKKWTVIETRNNVSLTVIPYNQRTIYFDGIIITLDKVPDADISFEVKVTATVFLKDPEEKYLPLSFELPAKIDEAQFWSDQLINDVIMVLPGLSTKLNDVSFANLDEASKAQLYLSYYEYLYKKNGSKRITVDTNNLMLDILVSDNVVLEDFKRIHRVLDVLKTMEEETKLKLENVRRQKRIDEDKLDDPDIENVQNVNIQNPI